MLVYLLMLETEEQKSKFELLYEKYRKLMFYVADQILHDKYLSEDAVHQSFIKIIENIDKIGEIECHKTKSFIVTIVRNHSINIYRKQKLHPAIPFEEIECSVGSLTDLNLEQLDSLSQAIIKLPVIYGEILTLKYVQEFSNAEIVKVLDIPQATVRKRLERAKVKVRKILEKEQHEDAIS